MFEKKTAGLSGRKPSAAPIHRGSAGLRAFSAKVETRFSAGNAGQTAEFTRIPAAGPAMDARDTGAKSIRRE
jgi:hypothetical protein